MNSKMVQWKLAGHYTSPFHFRTQQAVVPNVSWGFDLKWEADLLVLSKNDFLTEIEIKISLSDWKIDFFKKKHIQLEGGGEPRIKRFYYAAPEVLALRHFELPLPRYAGVISVSDKKVEIIKKCEILQPHRKLTEKEIVNLYRLGMIKAWDQHRPDEIEGQETQETTA